jgi:serine/threonine protein kinase
MDRGTLKDYVESNDYNPRRDCLGLLKDISYGLAYLHSLFVIHGDISNVCTSIRSICHVLFSLLYKLDEYPH